MYVLDKIDRHIISELQKNARISLSELSGKISLTIPATASRIKKLETAGYITGYAAQFDYRKADYRVSAYIHIAVSEKDMESFVKTAEKEPYIAEYSNVTGPYSILAKVMCHTSFELNLIAKKLSRFGKIYIQVVLSTSRTKNLPI